MKDPVPASAAKDAVRARALAQREALSDAERARASADVVEHVRALPEWRKARVVASYVPIGSELDARPLLRDALSRGHVVAVPHADPATRALTFHAVPDVDELARGTFSVPEPDPELHPLVAPEAVDFALVPGLAFDVTGHRLGYGHGYFDRWLGHVKGLRVGLTFEAFVHARLPVAAHDVPVDVVVTEACIRRVG